jgi:hypothetical protein
MLFFTEDGNKKTPTSATTYKTLAAFLAAVRFLSLLRYHRIRAPRWAILRRRDAVMDFFLDLPLFFSD